ncbi:MAG: type II secretion system minor pseudopilin GspI [Moraxellaceae bacterium]|nr:type II secretion system minor pseudopilin GspI [Moraxellaceae bacterium]
MSLSRGFTLIEVLVALAIFAIAAVALLSAQSSQLKTDQRLEDKMLAHWVGLNHLTELELQQAFPETGQGQRKVRMADRDWLLTSKVSPTPSPDVRRIDVAVSEPGTGMNDAPPAITRLSAFLPRPRRQNAND